MSEKKLAVNPENCSNDVRVDGNIHEKVMLPITLFLKDDFVCLDKDGVKQLIASLLSVL